MTKTHILFDFDGTLVDSAPAILATFTEVLRHHGLPPCRSVDSSLIGPPLRPTLEALSGRHDPATLDLLCASFRSIYDDHACLTTAAYPGWAQALQVLRTRGLVLAIATNKRLLPTLRILDALGWRGCFAAIHASDSHPQQYSDKTGMIAALLTSLQADAAQAVYIGDTEHDGVVSAANQVEFWPVSWGYGRFGPERRPLATPAHLPERLGVRPA